MRHGRKSRAKTFNGFKEHFVLDLDSHVTREVVVRPANEPEHEAVELLAETLEQGLGLLQLDIDLGYMASPRIAQWAAHGGLIIARPRSMRPCSCWLRRWSKAWACSSWTSTWGIWRAHGLRNGLPRACILLPAPGHKSGTSSPKTTSPWTSCTGRSPVRRERPCR